MYGIMRKNQITIFRKYEIIKPPIHKIDFIIDNGFRDCHNQYFHRFESKCVYGNKLTILLKLKEIFQQFVIKNMKLFELKKN